VAGGGVASGQEDVEKHAARVHIRGGRNRLSCHLFRRRELRRQRARNIRGDGRTVHRCITATAVGAGVLAVVIQQLRDPEVQHLHTTVVRDEHVRRFEITMDDEARVRVRDGVEHLQEQAHAGLDR